MNKGYIWLLSGFPLDFGYFNYKWTWKNSELSICLNKHIMHVCSLMGNFITISTHYKILFVCTRKWIIL
jgi:hypothetical protein